MSEPPRPPIYAGWPGQGVGVGYYIHPYYAWIQYLTSVIDLYDRKTVGWSLGSSLTAADTAIRAYRMAVRNRKPQPGMIFHSDRGVQYASEEFRNTLDKNVYKVCPVVATVGITP